MKNKVLFCFMAAAILAATSCQRVEPTPPELLSGESRIFTVCCPAAPSDTSRTTLDGLQPRWSEGDALWVSDGTSVAYVEVPAEYAGATQAELKVTGLDFEKTLYFLYPFDENATVASGNIVTHIPVRQSGAFKDAHLAVASCEPAATAVELKNASAILTFTVANENTQTIQFCNESAPLAGDFKIKSADGTKSANVTQAKRVSVDVNGRMGTYYVSCMAGTLPAGSRITAVSRDGRLGTVTTSAENALVNGALYDLGCIDEHLVFDENAAVTLGTEETANCYVINTPGSYRLPAVVGNSNEEIMDVSAANLIWETVNTSRAPELNSLIAEVVYADGYLYFRIPDGAPDGNALISVNNDEGDALWSWHIWILADGFQDQTFEEGDPNPFSGAILMDRNLGALTAEGGPSTTRGFFYQYGRKDPFPGISARIGTALFKMAGTTVTTVARTDETGTVEYAIAHPTAFIYKSSADWLVSSDDLLWSAFIKTVYDPCPAGYHIPQEDAVKGITKQNSTWDDDNKGRTITINGQTIWFDATGCRVSGGTLSSAGSSGYYWCDMNSSANGYNSWLFGTDTAGVRPTSIKRACSFAVRCQKYVLSGVEQTLVIDHEASAGVSFRSPYLSGEGIACANIFWGDDSSEPIGMSSYILHPYTTPGPYTVTVKGYSLTGFSLKSFGDITLIDVSGFDPEQ